MTTTLLPFNIDGTLGPFVPFFGGVTTSPGGHAAGMHRPLA
jgi:hypothetical protein